MELQWTVVVSTVNDKVSVTVLGNDGAIVDCRGLYC